MGNRSACRLTATFFMVSFCLGALFPAVAATSETPSPVRIDSAHISVVIDHHYAVTTVEETLTNPSRDGWQHVVRVAAPDLAFITRFAISAGGLTYESRIEASDEARGEYNATVAANQAAALVESRETDVLEVLVSIPANTTITVHLAYEQLVHRTAGEYRYRFPLVALASGRTIGALSIDGTVTGASPVEYVSLSLGTFAHPAPTDLTFSHRSSHLVPTADLDLRWSEPTAGGAGAFFTYAGAQGTTFVHVFSADAEGLAFTPLPKDIVFVIDVSGSMADSMGQVKSAFSGIIRDLRADDRFDVVAFDEDVYVWSPSLAPASEANVASSVAWVNHLSASGGTDIDTALYEGVTKLLNDPDRAPALVLLSDGEATVGIESDAAIRANLRARNTVGASVYTLAFGSFADFELLRALAFENDGDVRRIEPGGDAAAQIRGFYDTVDTPLLRGVEVEYTDGVADAAPTYFARAYAGSDLTVVGTLAEGATSVSVKITGRSASGATSIEGTFDAASSAAGALIERAWAYERVRELLRRAIVGDAAARFEVGSLALEYRFVTEYTSLVVVLPPSLDTAPGQARGDLRVLTSGISPVTPVSPTATYHGAPPPRTAPGPEAFLVLLSVACVALLGRRALRRPPPGERVPQSP